MWLPSPLKSSRLKAVHSSEGSNVSLATVSPVVMEEILRSVLSTVVTPPEVHAEPGLIPTWPNESTMTPPFFRTMASFPLNEMFPLVCWAAIVLEAWLFLITNVPPGAMVPVRFVVLFGLEAPFA